MENRKQPASIKQFSSARLARTANRTRMLDSKLTLGSLVHTPVGVPGLQTLLKLLSSIPCMFPAFSFPQPAETGRRRFNAAPRFSAVASALSPALCNRTPHLPAGPSLVFDGNAVACDIVTATIHCWFVADLLGLLHCFHISTLAVSSTAYAPSRESRGHADPDRRTNRSARNRRL